MVTNTKEYMKKYYNNNKDKFKKSSLKNKKCDCGCEVRSNKMASHKRTNKHKLLMENIELKSKLSS